MFPDPCCLTRSITPVVRVWWMTPAHNPTWHMTLLTHHTCVLGSQQLQENCRQMQSCILKAAADRHRRLTDATKAVEEIFCLSLNKRSLRVDLQSGLGYTLFGMVPLDLACVSFVDCSLTWWAVLCCTVLSPYHFFFQVKKSLYFIYTVDVQTFHYRTCTICIWDK